MHVGLCYYAVMIWWRCDGIYIMWVMQLRLCECCYVRYVMLVDVMVLWLCDVSYGIVVMILGL